MEGMIELPADVDLVKVVKAVYDLSNPQGLGHLHFKPQPLSDEEAKEIVARSADRNDIALSTDYVNGRACKFSVYRRDGKLWMRDKWFDHSDGDLKALRAQIGC